MNFEGLLLAMAEQGASDLYLKAGNRPFLRVDGQLVPQGSEKLAQEAVENLAKQLMGPERAVQFKSQLEMNFAFERHGLGRFRANTLMQKGALALVIRRIKHEIQTFDELHLPAKVLQEFAQQSQGLILVTGATSSGKSTTLASIMDYINRHASKHIVTLEDPIEFIFEEDQSLINQREIGTDTLSFSEALRNVLRQCPDVIYISDIRDMETVSSALMAAEAGNLVLSCLHTVNVENTIERLISFFPPHQHHQARLRLSLILQGIVSIRLLPRQDGQGRIPACEVLVATPTIRELIREGRTAELSPYLEDGGMFGMQTFNQSLAELVRQGDVTLDEAKRHADSPDELELAFRQVRQVKANRPAA